MDGQSFDPKFGTEIQPIKVVKPITDRNEFVQKIIQNRTEVKPQSWFKVENLNDDGEDIAEQTGASEFAAGIIRNDYDPQAIRKLEQDEISPGADETLVTQPYYNPTQDNRWLYGENLGITRYEALRRAVGLQEGQSFTEFYNVNKFVPQGFELDAKLLLREEKIKALETQMLNGEIGYDTFLYRAYGKDILKAQGHDFNSSLYWYTRRKQGYFDSIKNNLSFMNEVLRSAEQSYISESWNRTASSLKLSDIEAAVASEKPLSTVQMKELFPNLFEALSETIDSDRKIHDLFLSGQLGRQFQPFIDTNGDGKIDYYLHLNGRLYSAAEESEAQGHQARVKYDDEGNVASVFLPGTFEWDAGAIDSAVAAFSKVFWGVPEFLGYIVAATFDLGDFALGTGLGLWDGQDLGEARYSSAWYTISNKWANSWGATTEDFWIADQSLMNNGDINVENAARGVASAAGTIVGMMSLAWVGGFLGKAGAGASNLLKGTNLNVDKAAGFLYKGSQIKGFIPKALYTTGSIASRMSMIKNGAPVFAKGLWGMSAEAAAYLAFRDFTTTIAELAARQELTPGLSNEDVFARALEMTVVNGVITFTFRAVADQGISDRFATIFKRQRGNILSSVGKKQVTAGIEKAWTGYFTKFTKPSALINTIGDAVENWATMAMNMGVAINQDDYTIGESVANIVAGSAALANNPSALAMQIFQFFQTYHGTAFAFRDGYGQETRNVGQAMAMVKGTHEEVDINLRNAAANSTGSTRASILAIQKGYDEHRLYEHTYEFDAQGRIIKSEVVLNDKGEKVFTKDAESSQVAALLWLHNTMKDEATLAIDPKNKKEPDSIVSRALKKAIEKQRIEEMVIKHQLIFGVYNQHMERRRKHYEELLKKPNRARELFDKSYNIYKKIEVALGRSDSEDGQAARAALLLQMKRRSDLETRRALALKEEKLLSENAGFQEAWGDVSERLVVETISGIIDFSKLTVENLREIAEKRANAKGEAIDLKGDRGYLVRYILTNLSVKDYEALKEYMVKNPTSTGFASGIKLTVKGAGGLDEKKRQDVLKLLDLIATWESTLEAETGQKANFVKLSDGTYVIQASLENEFTNLNLYDYIGTTLRLATALKLEAVSGNKANFKTEALELMIDKLDQQAAGTFKKNLTSTDPKEKLEAQARVNKLLDNLVQKGILTYEQAARIYQDSYASPDALADTNSVAYFRNTLNKFNAASAEYNSNPENPTTKFLELQTEFGELMENASQPLKDAIFKQLNLTQKDLDDFKQKQYEALKNAKKTLGSLVGLRLPASLDLDELASSTGSSRENLSNLAERVFGFLQLLRTRRVAGFQFNDDLYNKVLDLYLRTVDNYFVNRPDDGFNTLNLGEEKLKALRDVLTLGFDKKGTASGLNVFDTPILMDLKLNNYLIAKGFTNEEINGVQRIIQTMQVNFIKDSLLVYNDQFLKNSNPELYRTKTENLSPEEIRELFYAEYIDEEYSRATKGTSNEGSIKDDDPERTKKREEFLLKNDPFFLRNLGDASPIQADEINGLEAQVKNYFAFIYQDTYDQRASGKIYISLNTFLPPMIAKAYRSLQYKDKDIPAIIEALDGPNQDLFAAFGFTSDERIKLQKEINELKNYLLKYPGGVLIFDITGKTGMDGLVEFLDKFGINFNQQKGKLREFGIQGRVPGETGSTSFKAIELVFGSTKQNELVGFKDEEYEEEVEVKIKVPKSKDPVVDPILGKTDLPKTLPNEKTYLNIPGFKDDFKLIPLNENGDTVVYANSRAFVLVEYKGQRFPFYFSSGRAGKEKVDQDTGEATGVLSGRWYHIVGVGKRTNDDGQIGGGWINKGSERGLKNFEGSPILRAISEYLSDTTGVTREKSFKNGVSDLDEKTRALLSEGFTPVDEALDVQTDEGGKTFGNNFRLLGQRLLATKDTEERTVKQKVKKTRRVPIYEEREVGRPFTVDDVIANLRAKEKEAFAQMRTPADLFASYEARLNNAFSNIIHIDENTIISPNALEEILLSTGVEITDAMQSKLVETFGALSEAEKVKFGKVGGLAEAIQVAFKQMGAAVPKDEELFNFKLLITLAKYIVDWKSSTTRKPIIYKVDPQQPNLIQDFKDTGIWKVQDLGDGKFQLEIEDIKNEADAFARIAKWINSKKGQAIDFNLLVPNTARFGGASVVTSPLDNEGKPVAGQEQSAGTGDYPFAVLKRNLQSGVDISSILNNKITFNLTKYELNEDSYTSLLPAINGKTIAALKKEFANTKNPFIRMAINTLSNGTVLSKFYAQEVKKAIRVVSEDGLEMSDDVIVTLMNPSARRVIAEVLSRNPDATVQELTGLVNTALRRTSNFNLTRNTSVSALEQFRLEGNLDYVNQSMLGTYRPQISKIPNIELSENDVRFIKDQLDKVYTVSDEENFTVHNKYSNVINALLASNDMDQELTAEQRKSRYGSANGGAIRFDVEALYYMSDEELEVLQDLIDSLNFTAGSKRIVGEKLNYLRLSRASKAKAPGDVRFVGAVGAATVTTAPGVLAVKAKDGGVEDQRSIASQFIKNLQTKATPSNVRDERVRLNNVLNNSKFSQIEQDWALYIDSELRKLNQGSTTGNRIILNLSKNDNLGRYVVGIASTAAVIEKQLLNATNKFQGTPEEAKQLAIEIATKMQILTDGSDFVSMATKYLFVDLKTGKIINTASLIDSPNNQQHLNDFSRAFIESIEDKDLSIGIIELNKNMMTGAGALSKEKFGYYIVNENNLSDIKDLVLNNILYQASLEDDLKNASQPEKILGVLNRTVTQKDFETELIRTFALLKQELNLKTDFFDEVGRVLVGTLSDTIYNNDGTYTTEEMYEARELGYELGLSDEDFQLLVSSRNRKIADVITFFINKDSLPLPIATIMGIVKRVSVQATESAFFQNRLRILEDIKAGRKNISNLKDEVREARNKARKAKRSRIAIFEEARKNLTGFYNGFDKEEIDLFKTLDLQNESDRKIFDAYQERFIEPRKSLELYLKVFQRDKDGLKEFFEYIKNPFYNPFKARDILINSLEKYRVIDDTNKASGMEESERVKTKEHDIKKAIISVDDLFRRVYEMDEYFRGELDKLELEKRNLKLIKGEEKYIAKKIKFIDFQKEKIRKQREYIDTVLQRQRYVNAFDANNNDLVDDYISGRKTSEQISNLIKAEADDIGKNEGEEARSQFLKDFFEDVATRYLLESDSGEALNYRLLKINNINNNNDSSLLKFILQRNKQNNLKDDYLERFLEQEPGNTEQDFDTAFFDIEAFYSNSYSLNKTGKLTSPFSATFLFLKRVSLDTLTKITKEIQDRNLDWREFKTLLKTELVRVAKTVYIPVYYFDSLSGKYKIVNTRALVRQNFPEYVAKYATDEIGGTREVDNYLNDIDKKLKANEIKAELTVKEHQEFKTNYVGRAIQSEIGNRKVNFVGYNNKKYDEAKLLDSEGDVGFQLITDKKLFDKSFDTYNDLISGLSTRFAGDRRSLDEFRRIERIDASSAHESEDDVFFTLFLTLKEMNRLEDSNLIQTSIIPRLKNLKRTLGIKGRLTNADVDSIEAKINERLELANINKDFLSTALTEKENNFFGDYGKLFDQSNEFRAKLIAELISKREALFKQSQFKKGWKIYSGFYEKIDPKTKEFANKITNEKTKLNIGNAISFVVSKLYNLFNEQNLGVKFEDKLNYRIPNSNYSIFDFVALKFRTLSQNDISTKSNLDKFREALLTGSENPVQLITALAKIINADELTKNSFDLNNLNNEFESFKRDEQSANVANLFSESLTQENVVSMKHEAEREKATSLFFKALEPIVDNFLSDVSDPVTRNNLLKDLTALIAYDFDQKEIKNRLEKFGFNDVLTNVNRAKAFEVLNSLAASSVSFDALYKTAQALSAGEKIQYFQKNQDGKYQLVNGNVDNESYYISESNFKSMFGYSQRVDLALVVEAVRKEYSLTGDQELYVSILRQPSDKQNTLHSYKVKIIPDGKGIQSTISADALKSNHSGDFDGDKLFIFKPTVSQLWVANRLSKYQHGALNAFGKVLTTVLEDQNVIIPNNKKLIKEGIVFKLSSQLFADVLRKDYATLIAIKDVEKQKLKYEILLKQRVAQLKAADNGVSTLDDETIIDIVKKTWLTGHDVSGSIFDSNFIYTTQNQAIDISRDQRYFALKENAFKLSSYIYKSKLGNIDSVTGLYRYPTENQKVISESKNSGYGRLFQTTGIHLTKDSLTFIKANPQLFISSMKNYILNDALLNDVNVDTLFDPTMKQSVNGKDFLIKALDNLQENIARDDFDVMFQSFLDIYDTLLRSSKDYNNTLFLASTTKDFTKSKEFLRIEAKERRQMDALYDLAFSIGIAKDFRDVDGKLIENLPDLLTKFNDTRLLDNSVRFQNESSDLAARFLLNITINQDKNDSIILKSKVGKTEFNNAQKTRIIYTASSKIGGVNLNEDSIYALPSAKKFQVVNMQAEFFDDETPSDGLRLLNGYEKQKIVTIKEPGGLKLKNGVVIPENSKIIIFGDSYDNPSLKNNVYRDLDEPNVGKEFVLFAFVDDLYSPTDSGFYKVTIPGTNKNKNTLNIFDIKASGLDRTLLEGKLKGDFVKGFDKNVFDKASASQPGKFEFYDKEGNLVESPLDNWERVEYVVEENNLSLIENTKNWKSNDITERFFDDPSIINNAGNPEALMYFGRLGKMFKLNFNENGTITAEIDNKELYDIQNNLKRLAVHDVDTNNGIRTLRILQAKTMIFNSRRLTEEQKNQELNKFLNYSNLNTAEGSNLISSLFNRLYNTPEEVARWENLVKKNKMYNFIFSPQLNDSLFAKTPTQMSTLRKRLISPTKAKPIQVNWIKGNVELRGDFATLQGDVITKEGYQQTGGRFFVDGLSYISHQDLLNLLLKASGSEQQISNSTINKLAPVIGARNKVGSTYGTRYLPALKSDVIKGDPNDPYDGQASVKTGETVNANRTQIGVYNEGPNLITKPKENETNMYQSDLYSIDENFLSKMLNYFGYDAANKKNKINVGEMYNDTYYSKLFKSYLATSLANAKNVDEKVAQLATDYSRFALTFDLEKITTDEKTKEVKVTLKRSQRTGKMSDFKQTLKEELGSVYYFDLQDRKRQDLENSTAIANLIKTTNLDGVDLLDAIEKSKATPDYFDNFKAWLQRREVYIQNKAEAQKKFREEYASIFDSDDQLTERYLQNNLEKSIVELETGEKETERAIHTVSLDRSKKQSMLVGKNMDEEDVIKLDPLKLTTSGVSEEDPRSFEVSQIVTLLKKEPSQIRGYLMSRINTIKDLVFKYGIEKEANLYMYRIGMAHKWSTLQSKLAKETKADKRIVLEDQIREIKLQFKEVNSPQELMNLNKGFEEVYGDIAGDLQDAVMNIYNYQNYVVRDSNEPLQDLYWIMLPTIKSGTNKSTFESIKQLVLNPEERLLNKNGHVPYEGYNFFRSIESTVYSLTKHVAAENFSVRAQKAKVLVNLPVVNFLQEKLKEFMNLDSTKTAIKEYDEEGKKQYEYKVFSVFQETISNTLSEDSDIIILEKNYRTLNPAELYVLLYNNIEDKLAQIGLTESEAGSTMKREQFGTLNYNKAKDALNLHAFRNDILARLTNMVGKDTLTDYLYNELQNFATSKGYALADRYGRKRTGQIEDIRPLSEVSMEWVSTAINDNIGYLGGFKKNLITSALSGDVYLIDAKLQDHLHKYFYTTKAPSKFAKITRKLQSIATGLIMSNPFKMIDRVLKYSLTDLTFMTIANPKTMFKVPQSRKDLSAFFQSKSGVISKDLAAFFATQGIDPAKTTFDTVLNDFEGVQKKGNMLDNYFEFMGQPFEFQTLLVRYAYWLQTVEDLNNGKENVYGSAYYNKDNVQKIQDTYYETTDVDPDTGLPRLKNTANENKAAYLMAQQLGSPGDFPLLAKDLNGIFMFTTFPLALVRWAKGEAFSMATAVKNLFVEGEQKQALNWLATQGGGLLGSALLVQALISLIASLYNVDEETEKEWQEKQALPDVLATILNGSPVFDIYNTADPVKLFSELTYAPFVEAAQENKRDAIYGRPDDNNIARGDGLMKWVFQNILGKVNPVFKDPVEVVLGISSLGDSVYLQDGPGYENFVRKMSAYIFGGSGSRALANYIQEVYDDASRSPDLVKLVAGGMTRVIQAELGNSKAYKGDVKNYYKVLSKIKSFNYMNQRVTSYSPNTSTSFNQESYGSLKDELRSLFNKKADFSKIYATIINHLENGGSLQEVRSALNNITLIGQLDRIDDLGKLTEVLSEKEIYELEKAIIYEQSVFPWLNDFRENVRQSVESTYSRGSRYTPRYYQPYRRMYGDSRNVYYRPNYSRYTQNPFNAYRSAWYTINQIGSNKK